MFYFPTDWTKRIDIVSWQIEENIRKSVGNSRKIHLFFWSDFSEVNMISVNLLVPSHPQVVNTAYFSVLDSIEVVILTDLRAYQTRSVVNLSNLHKYFQFFTPFALKLWVNYDANRKH